MKNNKGFVLTETLVVTVFLISIFTFIYVSIVPLLGKYEDLINREKDIDIVYKLYHIRKMIMSDANRNNIVASPHNLATCEDFNNPNCSKLMEYLDLNTDYILIYADNIYNSLSYFQTIDRYGSEIYQYMKKYQTEQYQVLILYDTNRHTIAHLAYYNR